MKHFNLSQILKNAHRLYKNEFQRRGRSWSECLKAAWSWAKDDLKVLKEKTEKLQVIIAESWKEAESMSYYNPYNDLNIPMPAFYPKNNKGALGSQYCGD